MGRLRIRFPQRVDGPDRNAPQRPAFDIVTGVSTGAIMAPFVFAGPQYDDALADAYDGVSTEDVARKRSLLSLLSSNSLYDTGPCASGSTKM